jgi:hypothetical protein
MKKVITVLLFIMALSCYKKDDNGYGNNNNPPPGGGDCGTYNGYQLYKDNEGCYYSGENYSKVYVDASNCKCQ